MAAVSLLTCINDQSRSTTLDLEFRPAPVAPGGRVDPAGEILKFRTKTIRLLNQKLNESAAQDSNTLLFAVYKLFSAEVYLFRYSSVLVAKDIQILLGNFEEADIHRQGLARIILLRGGLQNIPPIFTEGILL